MSPSPIQQKKKFEVYYPVNGGEYEGGIMVTGYNLKQLSSKQVEVDGVLIEVDDDIYKIDFVPMNEQENVKGIKITSDISANEFNNLSLPQEESTEDKIKRGVKDFANRFEGVMKDLAGEESITDGESLQRALDSRPTEGKIHIKEGTSHFKNGKWSEESIGWEKEFDEKFVYIPPPEQSKHYEGRVLLRPYEIKGSVHDIKSFIRSTLKDQAREIREKIRNFPIGAFSTEKEKYLTLNDLADSLDSYLTDHE